jgi:hypothetical protein
MMLFPYFAFVGDMRCGETRPASPHPSRLRQEASASHGENAPIAKP